MNRNAILRIYSPGLSCFQFHIQLRSEIGIILICFLPASAVRVTAESVVFIANVGKGLRNRVSFSPPLSGASSSTPFRIVLRRARYTMCHALGTSGKEEDRVCLLISSNCDDAMCVTKERNETVGDLLEQCTNYCLDPFFS